MNSNILKVVRGNDFSLKYILEREVAAVYTFRDSEGNAVATAADVDDGGKAARQDGVEFTFAGTRGEPGAWTDGDGNVYEDQAAEGDGLPASYNEPIDATGWTVSTTIVSWANQRYEIGNTAAASEVTINIDGNLLPCGKYGVDIVLTKDGEDARVFDFGQFVVVETNADASYPDASYEYVVDEIVYHLIFSGFSGDSYTKAEIDAMLRDYVRSADLAAVAISGKASDLTNDAGFITAADIPTNVSAFINDAGYLTSYTETDPVFSASAAAGITAADITAWNAKSDFSGNYNDLTNKPTIPTVPTNVSAFTNDVGYLTSFTETDPVFSASAAAGITAADITAWNAKSDFSGNYNDLTNKPTIPAAQVNADWNASSGVAKILNKPTLAAVATSGSYNDLSNRPTIPTVPTNVSAFTNDVGYLTSFTETDPVFSASAAAGITAADITAWNAKSDFSGNYNDLTNKPTIPTKTSDLTNDSGFITSVPVTSVNGATGAVVLDANDIAYDSNFSVKSKIDTIISGGGEPNVIETVKVNGTALTVVDKAVDVLVPTKVSDLTNDAGFITSAALPTKVSDLTNDSGFITSAALPTKVSDLTNDAGYITSAALSGYALSSEIPTKTSDLTNDSGFITSYTETDPVFSASAAAGITAADITAWNAKSDFSGNYNDLTNKPTIPTVPTISTNIAADATSDTKTASPKAVKDYVDANAGGDAVKYTQQSLTDAQKAQARANIGAEAELETESVSAIDLETPVETSYPSGGFRSNKIYDLGTLTGSQTFALYTTGIDSTVKNEWVWSFETGSTAPTVSWPSGMIWKDGSTPPTINTNCLYEISVRKIGSRYVGYPVEVKLS